MDEEKNINEQEITESEAEKVEETNEVSDNTTAEEVAEEEYINEPANEIKPKGISLKARLILICVAVCLVGFWGFNNQFTKGLIYNMQNLAENAVTIKLENGFGLNTGIFDNVIVSSSRNSVKLYNEKGELIETEFTEEIYGSIPDVVNLAVKTAKNYMLAYDEDGKIFYKINKKGKEFNTKLDYNIVFAKPFDNGMFAVVTEDSGSNHQIRVYNKDCKEVYIWHSGVSSVTDVSVNNKGDKMAVASIETLDGKITTKVSLFNLNETLPYTENVFTDNMITSVHHANDNNIVALGDKYLSHINSHGKITSNYSYNNRRLHTYKHLDNGSVALAYQQDENNVTQIEIISKKGAVKGSHKIEAEVISLDNRDGNVLVGTKSEFIILGNRGMRLRKSRTSREIKKALFIDENKFALIGNSEIKICK
ncbi:MAG: hypothetical protein IJC74_06230 [Clostridia bacterium]|nr:hypothetical protein [Clostridia bacterium]